ncbi:MAG: 16S rRNA (cytidine(1402)-2'-O)-methyltransferase [Alloprevotella sp.]|nr:16S rRNA (cytidine(1402)-2'-O)-methyltransferase [Alloprevotella sp.]
MLYLVPTPVGNLEDITLRALRILKEVDVVLAEDTRTSGLLLKHFDIQAKFFSHHKFNEHQTASLLASRMAAGEQMALVSDAGTPAISDPGFMLVRACIEKGVEVQCLPGPTAFVPALAVSGLPCERFAFEGFLPQKKGRASRFAELADEARTMIFYESPYRVVKTLSQMAEAWGGERRCAVCREISKIHEECVRGTLQEVCSHFQTNEPRGEFVILVEGVNRTAKKGRLNEKKEDKS